MNVSKKKNAGKLIHESSYIDEWRRKTFVVVLKQNPLKFESLNLRSVIIFST